MQKRPKIRDLKPRTELFEYPQCCVTVAAPVRNPDWRKEYYAGKPNDYTKCQRPATIELDGKFYCRPHAGWVALRILLEEEENKDG